MAYTVTVTLGPEIKSASKINSNPGLRVLFGKVDVSSYHSTKAEITAVTRQFSNTSPHVVIDGVSDNGFFGYWDQTSGFIKCYALAATTLESASSTELQECVNDVDVGVFNFIAVGLG